MSSLENQFRALKREGRKYSTRVDEYYDECEKTYAYEVNQHPDAYAVRSLENVLGHVPMKKESELLRKLMSENGLSAKEVREHKKYRILLSDAAKLKTKVITNNQKKFLKICKDVMKELNLPIWNPLVEKEIRNKIKGPSELEYFSKYIVSEYMRISSLKKKK